MKASSDPLRFEERIRQRDAERNEGFSAGTFGTPASEASRQHLYSRFIPREELQDFSAWQPSNFGQGRPAPAPAEPASAGGAAPEPTQPEPPQAPAIDWDAEVAAARQQGYQAGYDDGLESLEAFKEKYAGQVTAQVSELLSSMQDGLSEVEQAMADRLADVAMALAQQVVRQELRTQPQLIRQVAGEALALLVETARHIRLVVNPEDYALLAEHAAQDLKPRQVQLVSDARMARGGCLVESDIGTIDATVATRWRKACANLGRQQAWAGEEQPEPATATEPAAASEDTP